MQAKSDYVHLLSLAQQCSRPEDMVVYAKQLCQCGEELGVIERKLVIGAFKSVIASARTALKALQELESREEKKSMLPDGNARNIVVFRQYKAKLEQQITAFSNEFIALVDSVLLPQSNTSEQKAFYLKSQGDFYRYITECQVGSAKEQTAELALQAYDQAHQISKSELKTTNPTRLGVALNFSVFLYETLSDVQTAISISKEASELAINDIETVDDETHKLATDILIMMRDNLIEWHAEYEALTEQDEK